MLAEANFQVDGNFKIITERQHGQQWSYSGTYLQIETNRRIVHTVEWDAPMGYGPVPEQLEVTFTPDGSSTLVEFVHSGVPTPTAAQGHVEGWESTFNTLDALLKTT